MKHNMTPIDRILRAFLASVCMIMYVENVVTGHWAPALIVGAVLLFFTSMVNFCPLYTLLGIRKWEREEEYYE